MWIVESRHGVPIRLTEERWSHIHGRHPEVAELRDRLLETVSDPDVIQEGDTGELLAIRYYEQTPLTSKHLVVPYREVSREDGFILTSYLTNEPSRRRKTVWKR